MKNFIDLTLCGDYEVRTSSYYKDLLSKGETLLGEGLVTNVIGEILDLQDEEVVKVLEYIELINKADYFDEIFKEKYNHPLHHLVKDKKGVL